MIEMISTSSVQNSSARPVPQAVAAIYQATAIPAPQASSVASHIRVDNARNVAILEYRDNDGDVVRQYPSESQIEAFRRAQRIQEQVRQQVAAAAPAPDKAPAPQVAAPSSAPSAPAPSAEISVSTGGEGSTTSLVV